jgi:hypothetical protein
VHVDLFPERLDHVDLDVQRVVELSLDRLDMERLGPHPQRDSHADPAAEIAGRPVRRGDASAPQVEPEPAVLPDDRCFQEVHRRAAEERGHEPVCRVAINLLRCTDLLDVAVAHDGHAIAEREGFLLIVGDVDRRRAQPAMKPLQLGPHLEAEPRVEVRERLVEQEARRLADDRPSHRHPLTLPAGELAGLPIQQVLDAQHRCGLPDHLVDLAPGPSTELEAEGHVLASRQMGIEHVVLEDHGHVAILGRNVAHGPRADRDRPASDAFQPGDQPQRGGLATAGRPDQHQELAVGHLEVEITNGLDAVGIELGNAMKSDSCHDLSQTVSFRQSAFSDRPPASAICPADSPSTRTANAGKPIVDNPVATGGSDRWAGARTRRVRPRHSTSRQPSFVTSRPVCPRCSS